MSVDVSAWKHFTLEELRCKSGEDIPPELLPNTDRLVRGVLDPVRERYGLRLNTNCGYRSPAYNAKLYAQSEAEARAAGRVHGGVAKDSAHILAAAWDGHPDDIKMLPTLYNLVLAMYRAGDLPELGGIGLYPGWIHLDVRKAPDGHLRKWLGTGVASEPPLTNVWMPR